ncbi:hypothetical protein LCGC14_0545860 [marine sediment metagenome]|uniref:Uncharacterized protein n=1 Tax=marine sediment metagenome TaxID=412755 RepID=A0A0F9UCQ3_9ZZZZ
MKDLGNRSFEGKLEVKYVRLSLIRKFRVGKTNFSSVIREMRELGLLEYEDCKTIIIKWKPRKR